MKNNDLVTVAAVVILAPIVIGSVVALISLGASAASKIAYSIKIKNGLRKGSIVEIDGKYYEVQINDTIVEEA